jgi:hypothetical protein
MSYESSDPLFTITASSLQTESFPRTSVIRAQSHDLSSLIV